MILTIAHVLDAFGALHQIAAAHRTMPLKGKFLLARMLDKLRPEYDRVVNQRNEMIAAYGLPQMSEGDEPRQTGWLVPPDKVGEFAAAWKEIAETEIEVDVQPIALSVLDVGGDSDGAIEIGELVALGELVSE